MICAVCRAPVDYDQRPSPRLLADGLAHERCAPRRPPPDTLKQVLFDPRWRRRTAGDASRYELEACYLAIEEPTVWAAIESAGTAWVVVHVTDHSGSSPANVPLPRGNRRDGAFTTATLAKAAVAQLLIEELAQ